MNTSAVSLREAAREAMARAWAVLPVAGKRPTTRHGVHDASRDQNIDRPPIVVPPTVLVQRPPEAWGEGR